jgi:hypothetical protein
MRWPLGERATTTDTRVCAFVVAVREPRCGVVRDSAGRAAPISSSATRNHSISPL